MVQACDNLKTPYFYVLYGTRAAWRQHIALLIYNVSLGFGGEKKVDLTGLNEHQVNDKLKEAAILGQFLPRNNFTPDGEFTPKDIDIIDYALLKKNVLWQQSGVL